MLCLSSAPLDQLTVYTWPVASRVYRTVLFLMEESLFGKQIIRPKSTKSAPSQVVRFFFGNAPNSGAVDTRARGPAIEVLFSRAAMQDLLD